MGSKWAGLSQRITSRTITVNDLDMHVLEATPELPSTPPLILLLHGFPELSYSWRKIIVPITDAGYHVVAPDQRGYGRTKCSAASQSYRIHFTDDVSPFRVFNLVKDIVALVHALGYTSVAAVVGHDFGSLVAAYCALIRPDLFKSVVMMSAPFQGPPSLPFDTCRNPIVKSPLQIANILAKLNPPRKHYAYYFSTAEANTDMCNSPDGLPNFLRTYYHVKSADSIHVTPHPLSPTPTAMSVLPHYYIMPLQNSMPQAISADAPSPSVIASNEWLTEDELGVYVLEYARTGFQGGLNWYRCVTDPKYMSELEVFSGMKVKVPAMFISGKEDWGVYQFPGAVELMRETVCEKMDREDFILVEQAGHWVQQEKAGAVVENLLRFLKSL